MKPEIKEEMLSKAFSIGAGGKISLQEWVTVR